MDTGKAPIYPVEPWHITEHGFVPANNFRNETAFALSNGYIGTRGTLEEGYELAEDEGLEGNFIGGFYESETIRYGEWNFGFPETSQSLLNLPNLKTTRLTVDGERLDLREGTAETCVRRLDMRLGCVTRDIWWTSPRGRRVHVETVRFVSLERKNLMAQRMRVTPEGGGELRFESLLEADVENHTRKTNPLVDYGPFGRRLEPAELAARGDEMLYRGRAGNSGLVMACGSLHVLDAPAEKSGETGELSARLAYRAACAPGQSVTLDKYMVYTSCLDMPEDRLAGFVREQLALAGAAGFDALMSEQGAYTRRFWDAADIQIDGDGAVQQGIRFNLFHIMQAAGRDGRTGMGAKGLSGEGYEGHYFWDTEIYVLPVFTHTVPELAKRLLDYRYHTLGEARERARVLGHPTGALYPWRTINGKEASTYLPLGTAQYHINADVAYAFWQYVQVSGDTEYLKTRAAEVLCETARVWADVGCFSEARGGRYCICCVTGPDEYTAFVDNNFYTNLMARENLRAALAAAAWLRENDTPAYGALAAKIGLEEHELALWQKIADNMYFPYDEKRRVYLEDDGLLLRKEWDDSRIPPEKRHLLYENYHPLFLWRQRMLKQADGILGMVLHSHLFTREELRRNYDFYQRLTLHHSSLSTCVFGILAARIGDVGQAAEYFAESARMDLDDHHNNFGAGIHAANMAGSWQAIVYGFAGLRTSGGRLELAPVLPAGWGGYAFGLRYRGGGLRVRVYGGGCEVSLETGSDVSLSLYGETHTLKQKGDTVHAKL